MITEIVYVCIGMLAMALLQASELDSPEEDRRSFIGVCIAFPVLVLLACGCFTLGKVLA